MKKEVFLAIFIGSLIGLVMGFGFYKANRAVKERAQNSSTEEDTTAKNSLTPNSQTEKWELKISYPENNQVFFDNVATISGQTAKKSPVIILGEKDEYTTESDINGYFSQSVELIKGINDIRITSVYNFEESQEKTLSLVYTSEDL